MSGHPSGCSWVLEALGGGGFHPDEVLLAGVPTPADFRVLDIGSDYMLGVATDNLSVERSRLWALESRGRDHDET